jgi:hypothetical protein
VGDKIETIGSFGAVMTTGSLQVTVASEPVTDFEIDKRRFGDLSYHLYAVLVFDIFWGVW